jgi:hypothetical protein
VHHAGGLIDHIQRVEVLRQFGDGECVRCLARRLAKDMTIADVDGDPVAKIRQLEGGLAVAAVRGPKHSA